jgi:hypothetical protein
MNKLFSLVTSNKDEIIWAFKIRVTIKDKRREKRRYEKSTLKRMGF